MRFTVACENVLSDKQLIPRTIGKNRRARERDKIISDERRRQRKGKRVGKVGRG